MASYRFKPGLVPSLVVLLLLPIFIRLGFWQLDRAEQKQTMQQDYEHRAGLVVLLLLPIFIRLGFWQLSWNTGGSTSRGSLIAVIRFSLITRFIMVK